MKTLTRPTAQSTYRLPRRRTPALLGDLVVAAFDQATRLTSDPRRAAELAAGAVVQLLAHAGRTALALRLAQPDRPVATA